MGKSAKYAKRGFLAMICVLEKKGKHLFLNTTLLVVMVSRCYIYGSGVWGDV